MGNGIISFILRWKRDAMVIGLKDCKRMIPDTVLYCTVLYCTVLYCTVHFDGEEDKLRPMLRARSYYSKEPLLKTKEEMAAGKKGSYLIYMLSQSSTTRGVMILCLVDVLLLIQITMMLSEYTSRFISFIRNLGKKQEED